ncbi:MULTISPECIES: conjugal transfer protein TraN [unclassified Variovorax]|uniref:conjugal transfer protein TraN n=1 Tax=unclassified Variovorax TaxID=663243 RepID=UPI00076D93DA|nr:MULTISPECIES: conjugal transfer protein TraN [unclassified Variovorax]KWT86102.1 hypothetical protein APY03_3806 [Variovorax sp. WDL1]PNG50091.1 hypothetical protein CHC06_05714 [Variovorax sp. B2]PNG50963.1 hypothetical protein CHC07_05619 [Variovorax sp. B4]VTV17125.1 hypothetical protein WDL1P1_00128 [Variovorax sp. WDL1]
MRVANYLLGAMCALFTFTTAAQAPTAEEIAQAKKVATQAATQMRSVSVNRDAGGDTILNEDGTAQLAPRSSFTQAAGLDYFKSITGLEGLEQVASPGQKQQAGIAVVTATAKFDLNCRAKVEGEIRSGGNLTFRAVACEGAPVQSLLFKVCDNQQRLGQCAADSDFSQEISVPVGSFTTVSGVQVGAGCNSTDSCRISVRGTSVIGGSDATLKVTGQQIASNSTLISDLRTNVENGSYADKTRETGEHLRANPAQAAEGGTETKLTQADAQCSGPRSCTKWSTTSQKFTTSCTRTFPLTERITKYKLETAQCDIKVKIDKDGKVATTDTCLTSEGVDLRKDKSKIGETAKVCSQLAEDGTTCLDQSWTEYFATSDPAVLSVEASPSPVAGACDLSPLSESRYNTYQGGEWFGRTLDDAQCLVAAVDEATGFPTGVVLQLTNAEKAGCGIYTTPTTGVVCYGQPSATDDLDSCKSVDLAHCSMTSAEPASYTGGNGGLVMSQNETYQCTHAQDICVEWSKSSEDNACLNTDDITFGNAVKQDQTVDVEKMNAALVSAAIADAAGEGIDDMSDNPTIPKIFTGKDMRCKRATGGIGQLFGRNCCRMDMERPKSGQMMRDGCEMPTVELAAARRSKYTVYIGEYCSNRAKWPLKSCLEYTQTYCSFNGILPRVIHEQGRGQLLQMAMSGQGADIVSQNLNFTYLDQGNGRWTSPVDVNGVKVAAWQWPSYCADPVKAGEIFATDPESFECPGVVRTIIASCDNSNGCAEMPKAPEFGPNSWNLVELDPLVNESRGVSRYTAVKGACSPESGNCTYEARGWPMGQGGKAIVTRDLSWHLYSNEESEGRSAGALNQMSNIADLVFRTWSVKGASDGKTVPERIRIDYSQDGGQTWKTVQVPTDLRTSEFTFPNSDTRLTGRCDALTNLCSFRVTATSAVALKLWGFPQFPDCTGFTPGQLSAMDFGKMDLSEWLTSVMDKVAASAGSPSEIGRAAAEQFQQFNSQYADGKGTITVTAPSAAHYARISPSQGFGPFHTRLIASGYWPETTGDKAKDVDRVTAVEVDWGDCTMTETLQPLSLSEPGSGYYGIHVFKAPNELACGKREGNVTQTVTMTVHTTKSGVQKRTVTVENAYNKFPGGSGGRNDNVPVTVTVPASQATMPK